MSKHRDKRYKQPTKENFMAELSQWFKDVIIAINALTRTAPGESAQDAKIAALATKLGTDEGNAAASNLEFQNAINALVKALASLPVPVVKVPVILGLSAPSGSVNGGETVTINCVNATDTTQVHFGAVAASSFDVVNDSTVTAVSPAQAAGTVDVTITTAGGVSVVVAGDQYLYA